LFIKISFTFLISLIKNSFFTFLILGVGLNGFLHGFESGAGQ